MLIYHGSDHIIKTPIYGIGKQDNDYGSGFYTTLDKIKANEWAIANGKENMAVCNTYELNENGLNILYLDEYGPLAWIAEIIQNRGARGEISQAIGEKITNLYKVNTSSADIIIGYRADDSYIDVVDAFLKNELSIDEVDRMFHKGDLGKQVFIKSEKAFKSLTFKEYDYVDQKNFQNTNEITARIEVSKFLRNRSISIQINGYTPFGITARDVINNLYIYDPNFKYYEKTNIKPDNTSSLILTNKMEDDYENSKEYDEI